MADAAQRPAGRDPVQHVLLRLDPRLHERLAFTRQKPDLPATTIGSVPQTTELRQARAALRAGALDDAGYAERMRAEVEQVIRLQERLVIAAVPARRLWVNPDCGLKTRAYAEVDGGPLAGVRPVALDLPCWHLHNMH